MNIQFFANRTLAREAAKIAGVKPIDNGAESAPGKRWAIEIAPIVKVEVSTVPATPVPAPALKIDRPLLSVRHPNGKRLPSRRQRQTMVVGHQGNKIPVTWRKARDLVVVK